MTATIVTGGATPPVHLIRNILDRSDLVAAADGGLGILQGMGILPRIFVGDGDSLPKESEATAVALGWVPAPRDKDFSDTELALQACLDRGADTIHLVGGGEGRMDHLLSILLLFRDTPALKFWHTAQESCQVLVPGIHTTHHPQEATLSVFALHGSVGRVCTQGLQWELDEVDFSRTMSLSNRCRGTSVEWSVEEGRFLLMENHG